MKAELGGQRIGSGSGMDVELKNYGRSTHNLSKTIATSMAPGTLVPFYMQIGLPGDTHDIDLIADVQTHPTVGPLFASMKFQMDMYEIPVRLYIAELQQNALGIGLDMSSVYLPRILVRTKNTYPFASADSNEQVNASCLLKYLGIKGLGLSDGTVTDPYLERQFDATGMLAYYDIFKTYYANKQEDDCYMIHTPVANTGALVTSVKVNTSGDGTEGGTTIPAYPSVLTAAIGLAIGNGIGVTYAGAPHINDYNIAVRANGIWIAIADIFLIRNNPTTTTTGWMNRVGTATLSIDTWAYSNAVGVPTRPQVTPFALTNIDKMRKYLMQNIGNLVVIDENYPDAPYNKLLERDTSGQDTSIRYTQEGLMLKTYQSDLFNNWLKTDTIQGPNSIAQVTAISTASGQFTIDELNINQKIYNMLNRVAVSGGSYYDWLTVTYDNIVNTLCNVPMYMGGLSKEIIFQEVIASTTSPQVSAQGNFAQPLGTLAGRGKFHKDIHKGGSMKIKPKEISLILGIMSITPRIQYSQGNRWMASLVTVNDYHKPELDEIGFQNLISDWQDWRDTEISGAQNINLFTTGKQPAWIQYTTDIDETFGSFAEENNEMFMTLNRRYQFAIGGTHGQGISDNTTYVDPTHYNYIFAQTDLTAMNFWIQVHTKNICRRRMSARLIPNL